MIDLTTAAKNARLTGLRDLIDTGAATAAILLYTAPRPTIGGTATGALLASIPLPVPCGVVSAGELTLAADAWQNASGSGDVAWARIVSRDAVIVADMGVGLTGSGADLEINSLTVYAGGLLHVDLAVLRE